jgi:hypothetical protein
MKKHLATFLLSTTVVFAQQNINTLNGTYALSVEGTAGSQPVVSLALLSLSQSGAVSGTEVVHGPGVLNKYAVQGSYSLNSDGTGTMSLTSQANSDDSSSAAAVVENYQILVSKTKDVTAIRTDNGYYTIGQMSLAMQPKTLKGAYVLAERGNGGPYAGLGELSFDETSAVTGSEYVETVGMKTQFSLSGAYYFGSDGFGTLSLNVPNTDAYGETQYSMENYIFVAGVSSLKAIRTDLNMPVVSTLSPLQ